MANIVASFTGGHAAPDVGYYLVGKSKTIRKGDFVVLYTEATTGYEVLSPVSSTEIAADFTNTNPAGILGMALCDVVTDSDGFANSQIQPTNVAGGAYPITPLPTIPAGIVGDAAASGRPLLPVVLANDWTEFRIRIQAASNAAVSLGPALIGDPVDIQMYNTTDMAADTGADTAVGFITRLDELDPYYNTSSLLGFGYIKIKPAFQQYLTGVKYSP